MTTYANDHLLPALPIPTLSSTHKTLLQLLKPITTEEDFATTSSIFNEFFATGGTAEVLQAELTRWQQSLPTNASWLRPLWDTMYLAWQGQLPIDMNYYFSVNPAPWNHSLPCFVHNIASTLLQLGTQSLPPEVIRNAPLSMDQFASMVATRISANRIDNLLPISLAAPATAAVVCNGHWFIIPLTLNNNTVLPESYFATTFTHIRKTAQNLSAAQPIGAITTANRDHAAQVRTEFLGNTTNQLSLTSIEQSLFVICLDTPPVNNTPLHPATNTQGRSLLTGPAKNRWFNKSLQIISCDDRQFGLNFEHAPCDASPWLYILQQAANYCTSPSANCATTSKYPHTPNKLHLPIRLLPWDISATLGSTLHQMEQAYETRANNMYLQEFSLEGTSRQDIKNLGYSPDTFVQLTLQVAYYHIFATLQSTYEAVAMRHYFQGRTDCARACSSAALHLAQAVANNEQNDTLKKLFLAAQTEHLARISQCSKGNGAERHMLGLQSMFTLHGTALGITHLPEAFTCTGWNTLTANVLSTSGLNSAHVQYFGFGPVHPTGFGIGYCFTDHHIRFVLTNMENNNTHNQLFANAIIAAANKLHAALLS